MLQKLTVQHVTDRAHFCKIKKIIVWVFEIFTQAAKNSKCKIINIILLLNYKDTQSLNVNINIGH